MNNSALHLCLAIQCRLLVNERKINSIKEGKWHLLCNANFFCRTKAHMLLLLPLYVFLECMELY